VQAFLNGHGGAGPSWAVHQAHIALASEGFLGHAGGPIHTLQQQYLPDRQTDLALASLVQTWGLAAGVVAVLAAAVLIWRLALASAAPRTRPAALVAGGLAALIGIECIVSLAGTLGILPLAGVPFPLIGLGGTSAAVHLAAIGVVLGSRRDGVRRRLWTKVPQRRFRPRLVRCTAAGMSGVLGWCLFYAWDLQASRGADLRTAATTQMTRCTRIPAVRGTITDRHGTPIATGRMVHGATGDVAVRFYPYGKLLAPILGFVGIATPADTLRVPGLPPGELVGRTGIEQQYDGLLRGLNGRHCRYVDPAGRPVGEAGTVAPVAGHDVRLSLDLPLQKVMSRELAAQVHRSGGDLGGAVALDPRTGQVLAMASSPSYDNAVYGPPVDGRALAALQSAPTRPTLEHATQLTAPPGSVFKLVVAATAMAYGTIPPNRVVPTGGSFTFGGHVFHNWMTLGPQDLGGALAWSNDVYFYKLALALGPDKIQAIGRQLGVGEPTGVDLPGESSGIFDDPASIAARGGTWYGGTTVILGIGQGYLTVTPLQVARWTAGVATGCLVVPRLGLATGPQSGPGEVTALPGPAPQPLPFADKLAPVRAGMREAAQSGTAAVLGRILPGAGGKTGSAQDAAAPHGQADSWFTAAAPVSHPSLVITAFVRGGGHGASTAGPVVASTLTYYVAHQHRILATGPNGLPGRASDGECLQHPGQAQTSTRPLGDTGQRALGAAHPEAKGRLDQLGQTGQQ
jgi:cell division protein FtsI/penicillin-binding protein 2